MPRPRPPLVIASPCEAIHLFNANGSDHASGKSPHRIRNQGKQPLLFLPKKQQKNSHSPQALAPHNPKTPVKKNFFAAFDWSPEKKFIRKFRRSTQINFNKAKILIFAYLRSSAKSADKFLLSGTKPNVFFKKEVLAFLLFFIPLAAHATNIAAIPISRANLPWWQARFTTTLAEAKTTPNAKIIWLGDSITQFWQRTGTMGYDNILPVWQKYYAPYNALDFGIVGDTTSSLLWRLDHGQVAGLHPSLAIILIGANNLGHPHWPASLTTPGIEAVVTTTHTLLPTTHILLLGVLPSIRSPWVDTQTRLINQSLAKAYANNPTVTFIDVSPVLTTNGHPDPTLYIDPHETPPRPALHPDATGMSRIAAYLAPTVQRFASVQTSVGSGQ